MTSSAIPLFTMNRQHEALKSEISAAIAKVCDSCRFILGPECEELEQAVARYCGVKHAIGCASGSDALLLALLALDIQPGDEVILPSFTFFATAGAVARLGAKPVFADIEPAGFNLDPAHVARLVTPRTRAIIPVHLFGQCADLDAIGEIARRHNLAVIEDAAQSIGAELSGRRACSIGDVGCLSFYPTKNLGGPGDGGMITTQRDDIADRLKLLRVHGMRPRYYHHVVGINSRLDTLQAAVLLVKLAHLDRWTNERRANAERYTAWFKEAKLADVVVVPPELPLRRHVWNQFTIRVLGGRRDELRDYLAKAGIGSEIYYPIPLHLQECFQSLGYEPGSLPATEQATHEVLSLPIFPELAEEEQGRVVSEIANFFGRTAAIKGPHFSGAAKTSNASR